MNEDLTKFVKSVEDNDFSQAKTELTQALATRFEKYVEDTEIKGEK